MVLMGFAAICILWGSLYFLEIFMKSTDKLYLKFENFKNFYGFSFSLVQIRWCTTYFNKFIFKFGSKKSKFLKFWFNAGIIFSIVLMLMSTLLLMMTVVNTLYQKVDDQQMLTPIVPGVNLPNNQLVYYLVTLLMCGIFHELGHAIAAVGEEVRVNGFGLFVMAIYPGAFVDVNMEHVENTPPLGQLRIFCAGVWHNIVIVLTALVVIAILPFLLAPMYASGHGVTIIHLAENSPVTGENGAAIGEVITSLNGQPVRNFDDWTDHLKDIAKNPTSGFCVDHQSILKNINITSKLSLKDGIMDCCNNSTSSHLCFSYNCLPNFILGHEKSHICMAARLVLDGKNCSSDLDCSSDVGHRLAKSLCLKPAVDNSTWLMKVSYKSPRLPLLFLGHPYTLHHYISTSNHEPRLPSLPLCLPHIIEMFCKYLVSLSGALAIINIVPCYALDGQWIAESLCNCILPKFIKCSSTRNAVFTCIIGFGTLLVFGNVAIALWTLVGG